MITREIITQRIMRCTPRELQQVINIISWKEGYGYKMAEKTVQEIINLLAQPENIKEAEKVELETGEDYFSVVFDI